MSSPTWTRVALSSEFRRFDRRAWRLVEAQHRVSTLKLVDDLAEQARLEELIEATKPSLPPECEGLDLLLATPFRYGAVYPNGSRFRRAGRTAGVFYASEHVEAAIAEMAYYRWLFFADSPETPLPDRASDYSAFAVQIDTAKCLDLTAPPLSADEAVWTDPANYAGCQAFADAARSVGALAIRYVSVRDPARRRNVAVLGCAAFAGREPVDRQTWRLNFGERRVQALCEFPRREIEFTSDAFASDRRIGA
ncbi:MAG: RES family NAD+ phosphorylase [Hyphomicrobiales bacterium]|nr:RES family NAD+ phosphorylase [Hyphomicrobiales bacterium]MDE2017654.1 RES family NAD+ phosphorylase [Hyphomicrobiales bacterium]